MAFEPTGLQRLCLQVVSILIRQSEALSVLDIGCGSGHFLAMLAREHRFVRLVGMEESPQQFRLACQNLKEHVASGRVKLLHGLHCHGDDLLGFDAAVMSGAENSLELERLPAVEEGVFRNLRPGLVIITVPNREYVSGSHSHPVPDEMGGHPGWTRKTFEAWAKGVANRSRYEVAFAGIGPIDAVAGCPTQLACFRR